MGFTLNYDLFIIWIIDTSIVFKLGHLIAFYNRLSLMLEDNGLILEIKVKDYSNEVSQNTLSEARRFLYYPALFSYFLISLIEYIKYHSATPLNILSNRLIK